MDLNDILYLLALIFSICFGKYVNQITDVDKKQNVSTLAGFAIVLLITGFQCVYQLVLVAVNSFIILTSKRYSHILTFAFSFTFLTVLRYYQCLSGHTNLIQMMLTLKLIGLAYELQDNQKLLSKINSGHGDLDHVENLKYLLLPHSEINLANIVHYSFCYVGVLTGPYYKYQTYVDWFNQRIHAMSSSNLMPLLLSRLKFLPLYATVFLILSYFYSVQYVRNDEFYSAHNCLYRWLYSLPVFFRFKMRLYIGLLLSEAVAVVVGLGSYPGFTESRPGQGPTANVIAFRKVALGESELQPSQQGPADFSTVHSVDVLAVETEPTLRRTIKLWNTTVQFWMNQYVYKRVTDQKLRLYLVFFISALWHGVHSGYYLSLCYMPVYLYIEDLYGNKLRSRLSGNLWPSCLDAFLLVSKTLTLSALSMCFTLLSFSSIARYFLGIYCLPFFLHLLMYLGAHYAINYDPPSFTFLNNVLNKNNMNIFNKTGVNIRNNNNNYVHPGKPAIKSNIYNVVRSS